MANGDLIKSDKLYKQFVLIDAATAAADGVWIDVSNFERGSFHLVLGVGTLQIRGSNEKLKPENTAHGFQIGTDATNETGITTEVLPRWIKGRVSAHTSGTHNIFAVIRGTK